MRSFRFGRGHKETIEVFSKLSAVVFGNALALPLLPVSATSGLPKQRRP